MKERKQPGERQKARSKKHGGRPKQSQPALTATPAAARSAGAAAPLRVSTLALTRRALVALNARHPNLAQVGFSFVASAATTVHVVLARLLRAHGHVRWRQLHAYTLGAVRGTNSKHLSGRGTLVAGDYRLTLAPPDGTVLSLVFKLG